MSAAVLLSSCASVLAADEFTRTQPAEPPIIAVGDLHGDHAAMTAILSEAGLIDAERRWTGGRATLVQTGDLADRGPDTRAMIDDLMRLQREAKADGGKVVILVGNHEAMNMTGDLRYVHPGEYAAFVTEKSAALRDRLYAAQSDTWAARYPDDSPEARRARFDAEVPLGFVEHRQAWSPKGKIGRWIAKNPAIALIDGNLFVHGGLSEAAASQPVDAINKAVRRALRAADDDPASVINREDGPLWYRGLADGSGPETEAALDRVLAATGARRMIVGHTPERSGIRMRFDGKLVLIDTGASAHYNGTRSFLRISDAQMAANDNGTERALWQKQME